MSKLLQIFENRLFASAADEYNDRASESGIKRRYDEAQIARSNLISAIENLEQAAPDLLDACKQLWAKFDEGSLCLEDFDSVKAIIAKSRRETTMKTLAASPEDLLAVLEYQRKEIERFKAQRDVLLAACKALIASPYRGQEMEFYDAVKDAKAAIAKAEGKEQP